MTNCFDSKATSTQPKEPKNHGNPANRHIGFLGRLQGVGWINAVLPFNIALGPVSTLIPLLILNANGSVVEVGLAVTLFNAVSIPAALFWGFVTDRFQRRRLLIILSFSVTGAILVLLLFAQNSYWISFLYALFSFTIMASTTPLNLLVMETEHKHRWGLAFARFSMFSSIGQTVGLLLGMIWSVYISLEYLVVPLGVLSLVSAVLAASSIKEPEVVFERQVMVMNKQSFFTRLRHSPYLFLKIPAKNDFKRIFKNMRNEITRQTPLLYLAVFMFFLSAGVFNTSLVPALETKNISSIGIFLVILIGMIVQIVSFKFAGSYTKPNSLSKAAMGGLLLRATGYAALGVFAYLFSGIWFLIPTLLFYPLASGVAYSIYYTASNTMVFNTLSPRRNGSSLGVYSALAGLAMMAGSFTSGFLSFYGGFHVTFAVSSACLIVAAGFLFLMNKPQVTPV
ncbi:MAG: MFS transporter [Candidatus Bathyarchaeota archaeon]|nr:MFS transporter [Candidatus Bathyarchaeota archaeon]